MLSLLTPVDQNNTDGTKNTTKSNNFLCSKNRSKALYKKVNPTNDKKVNTTK